MANTGFKGIDVRQTGTALVFRSLLQASDGSLLTTGTTNLYIVELQSDGTIKTYDFNDNTFKTTACTTETLAMTYRKSNNATTDTGLWTAPLATLTGFTVGGVYLARVNNTGASPTDQIREFQYGSDQGDIAVTAGATGVAYIQNDTTKWLAGTIPAVSVTGVPKVDVVDILGTASAGAAGYMAIDMAEALPSTPAANSVGEALFFADLIGGRVNTAQAGASTTITLDASASADANAYIGDDIYLYGGTGGGIRGSGQRRTIVGYNTSTKVATVNRAWDTTPDNTSKFITFPQALSNVGLWNFGVVPATSQTGVPVTDPHYWNGTAFPSVATAGIPDVNVKNVGGATSTGTAGYVGVDWGHVNAPTTTVSLSNTTISASQAIASVSGAVGSVTAPVTASVSDKTGFSLSAAGVDAVMIEAGLNARQALSLIGAACAGAATGVDVGSPVYKGAGVATTRITCSSTAGDRSSVVLNPPA